MNCSKVSSLIPLYLSGDLDECEVSQLNLHARGCAGCARRLLQQVAFDARLRDAVMSEEADSSGVEARVRQAIAKELAQGARTRRWRFAMAGVAAALVLMFAGYRAVWSTPASGIYAAAARDHRMEVVDGQPRRWRTDVVSINELAAREGIQSSLIAAIAPSEFHLREGKLCKLDGRLYLHLVYTDSTGTRDYSVYLDGSHADGLKQVRSFGFGSEHVVDCGKALVVTDQPVDKARDFAEHAASVI